MAPQGRCSPPPRRRLRLGWLQLSCASGVHTPLLTTTDAAGDAQAEQLRACCNHHIASIDHRSLEFLFVGGEPTLTGTNAKLIQPE